MTDITDLFSVSGLTAKSKLILLGAPDSLPAEVIDRIRSLHIEHVSPAELMRQEISRRASVAKAAGDATLALLRRWFWARKPDAGFVLTDFPATLLQAQVFDEWLDARGENLDGVLAAPGSSGPVVQHYGMLGLLREAGITLAA